jgi:hypothetical protein
MSCHDWPTLRDMISQGKCTVVFMDKGLEGRKDANAEFMLPEFKMVWEDRYDPTDRDPLTLLLTESASGLGGK